MPPFRAQSGFARNDGYLEVDYLNWPFDYVMVALAVVAVSATFLFASTRGLDRSTAGVLQGLAFAGIAIAAPFFAQLASLAADQGSPYAVKKYAFGLITLLAVDLCVVIACLVPVSARRPRSQAALTYVVAVALVVVATYGTLSQPGRGYFTTTMVDLERRVEAVASSGDLGDDRRDYAIGLAGSDLWLDFMFSTAILRPHDVRPAVPTPPRQRRKTEHVGRPDRHRGRFPLRPSRLPRLSSSRRAGHRPRGGLLARPPPSPSPSG